MLLNVNSQLPGHRTTKWKLLARRSLDLLPGNERWADKQNVLSTIYASHKAAAKYVAEYKLQNCRRKRT
eukprot:scaffold47873_cov23-Tisochrysis_lutea.AAC.1